VTAKLENSVDIGAARAAQGLIETTLLKDVVSNMAIVSGAHSRHTRVEFTIVSIILLLPSLMFVALALIVVVVVIICFVGSCDDQ
jgi:hypothetical protein